MSAPSKIPRFVFDSYALIAFLEDEPGAARVNAILDQAAKGQAEIWLAIINFGEVVYITEREKGLPEAQRVIAMLDQLPIAVVEADRKLTFAAAHIKAKHSMSYADAFAAALAQEKEAMLVTGDVEFESVAAETKIDWLPSK